MELNKRKIVGLDVVCEIEEKVKIIRDHLKIAQDECKSYVDLKSKEIYFEVGDKKRKLSPRFVGAYEILDKVRPMVYRLALPPRLSKIHNVFHVSMLRSYRSNLNHVIHVEEVEVESNLSYEEEFIRILAKEDKELRNKRILLVKVLWRNHLT
ncbi:pol protein [Gossypium australe]|uniref:Pol protein n=1 Tax=Gossypium australe TaxID=47621 RepID=A0A5B6VBE7_9ROSI|nr:pol protein [Gossypium australe]